MKKTLKTSGDLRRFLYETMQKVVDGTIDTRQAMTASKLAAQINESLKVEVEVSLQGERLGYKTGAPGEMPLYCEGAEIPPDPLPQFRQPTQRVNGPTKTLTASLMGDPPPGRSALDQKKGAQ